MVFIVESAWTVLTKRYSRPIYCLQEINSLLLEILIFVLTANTANIKQFSKHVDIENVGLTDRAFYTMCKHIERK